MSRFDRRARTGMLVGVLAMFFAIDVAFLLSLSGLPFAVDSLGQGIIDVLPGWISIPLIERLQFWAKALLVIGVIALFFVSGAVTGLVAVSARVRNVAVLSWGITPWALAWILPRIFSSLRIEPVTSLIDAAAGAAVFLITLAYLLPAAEERAAGAAPVSIGRRRILIGAAGGAVAIALASLPLSRFTGLGASRVGNEPATARHLRSRVQIVPADPAVDALEGITPRITRNEDHYTVDTTLVKPRVDIATWRLDVKGEVDAPFSLSYDQLLDLEAVEQLHTLECISNYVGGSLISTALWTGVPLRDLLSRARVRSNAYDVVFTSVDGYTDSIPIAKAMDERTVVAYLMNGKTVPQDHGYPARMLIPNIYGMKNVKWLRSIDVTSYDVIGYWQERGWSDIAIVNTNTRIDTPGRAVRWNGGDIVVGGIAFAGSRGISKVEVSTDGGKSWNAAALEAPAGPLAWTRWTYRWSPSGAGNATLTARSTDGAGNTETPVPRDPLPDGATGYHSVAVSVQRG